MIIIFIFVLKLTCNEAESVWFLVFDRYEMLGYEINSKSKSSCL